VIAHNVSLMVVQAQDSVRRSTIPVSPATRPRSRTSAARRWPNAPYPAAVADRQIGGGARAAAWSGQHRPARGAGALGRSADRAHSTGQPRSLTQSEDLSAFRIVQEAPDQRGQARRRRGYSCDLDYADEGLRLTIADAGDTPGAPREQTPGDGHGLVGMGERVAMFGGTLSARPTAGRGFEVTAVLPIPEPIHDAAAVVIADDQR